MTVPQDPRELDFSPLRGGSPPPLDPAVLSLVGAAPAPVKPLWPTWARVAVSAGVGGGVTLLVLTLTSSRAVPSWLGLAWVAVALGWLGVTLGLTWLALSEARPAVSTESLRRWGAVVGVGLLFGVYALLEDLALDGQLDLPASGELVAGARSCLALGSMIELGPVLVIFFLLARGAPFRPVRAGVLGGVAAAGWSVLVLSIHCPSASVLHVVPFHLGVALVWGLLGAGVGLAFQARRRRRAALSFRGSS